MMSDIFHYGTALMLRNTRIKISLTIGIGRLCNLWSDEE